MIIQFLFIILGLVAAAVATSAVITWGRTRLDSNRKARVESDRQVAIAERALRAIANNTSGRPELDAQIALDEISARKNKDLN